MTITTTCVELMQYGGYILGILTVSIWLFNKGKLKVIGFIGAMFLAIGLVSTMVISIEKTSLRTRTLRAAQIIELPPKWQTFYEDLNKLANPGLQEEFIRRFVRSSPPGLSIDDYETLIGAKLSNAWDRSPAQKVLADSICLREMVIFDFKEKQKP